MKKLRERNCWTVVRRADIPKGTRVMGGRWTFKYKRDETGPLSKVSHRSRYVAKGFTQIKNVHYFESFAPVASFVTLRLVFALTALPHFHVNHYDVSVAFIESELDDSDEFLTGELFLPWRTANQYLARYWFAVHR